MVENNTTTNEELATGTPESAETAPVTETPKKKRKARRNVPQGRVYVLATFNNTIITVTDLAGNVLATASAGASGFRGSKKGTAYAAQVAAEKVVAAAKQNFGVDKVEVIIRGIGLGRDATVRTLINQRIQVESIKDATGIPHGGVRPRKAKRN